MGESTDAAQDLNDMINVSKQMILLENWKIIRISLSSWSSGYIYIYESSVN